MLLSMYVFDHLGNIVRCISNIRPLFVSTFGGTLMVGEGQVLVSYAALDIDCPFIPPCILAMLFLGQYIGGLVYTL